MSYAVMPLADWQRILESVRTKTGKSTSLVSGDVSGEIDSIGGDDWEKYFEGPCSEIILPTATKIKEKCFMDDTTLTSIMMPNVTSIGANAFEGCKNLAINSLPAGLVSIGINAFKECDNLALTSLPAGITVIPHGAFHDSGIALTHLPAGVTEIAQYAFYKCANLALTHLPAGVTEIAYYAFQYCSGLTSITFKGTPASVDSRAFNNCSNLAQINVPWAEGAVANAPWGATNATINYNYTGG